MKGRRRARRTALQALYELDLTDHDPALVIAGRIRALYKASLSGRLEANQLAVAMALVESHGAAPASAVGLDEVVAERGLDSEAAGQLLEVMAAIAPQALYAGEIVGGVLSNRDALDALIAKIAPEWPVTQMAPLDRNLMRVAIWEIGSETSPVRVAINE
ncbi:MAG: transcription antitermination factor NusB, partial [Anaerolineae bacterium]